MLLSDQEEVRRLRRQAIVSNGIEAYPARSQRRQTVAAVLKSWKNGRRVSISGRVRALRIQGGSAFLDLVDETGKIQVFTQRKNLTPEFQAVIKQIDLGDFLDVAGICFVTKRGERTIDATQLNWLAKALRPPPSAWHGLENIELRYRHRELDLLSHPEVRQVFENRSLILAIIRDFFTRRGFIEVETPMLQALPGGATARPFQTHHNALDTDLFLRVAPELYLKRLLIGGLGKVFELGKSFRNEGMDRDHNPEFTMLEAYAAYTDYEWMMDLTEDLLIQVAKKLHGRPELPLGKQTFRLKKPFPRITYRQAVQRAANLDIDSADDGELRIKLGQFKPDATRGLNRTQLVDELFKHSVRPNFIEPGFVIDHPLELSPLAKKKRDNPKYVERFQLLAQGTELANAFSELNDPIDQRERFEAQEKLRTAGDEEAQRIDEIYLRSMEYGMPPASGLGIGVDRLVAIMTGQKTLKDVILFPTLRPEAE